jgi:hypothetical protein
LTKEETLSNSLYEIYEKGEIFLKQKSITQWLKEKDMNTASFHNTIQYRRAPNKISRIVKPDINMVEGDDKICKKQTSSSRTHYWTLG